MGNPFWLEVRKNEVAGISQALVDVYVIEHPCNARLFPNKWTEKLNMPDSQYVSQFKLIGTHDSATGYYRGGAPMVKVQNHNITEQLNMGVRFLDLRIGLTEGDALTMFHGGFYLGVSFNAVVQEMKNFLDSNKEEFIVALIKHEHGDKQATINALEKYVTDNSSYFCLNEQVPKYGDAKGKIVVVTGFQSSLPTLSVSWPDNTTDYTDKTSNQFSVQDNYNGGRVASKLEVAENFIRKRGPVSNKGYNFNFLCIWKKFSQWSK